MISFVSVRVSGAMPEWISPFWKQIWTTSGVIICLFGQGMVMGFPACLLPALQAPASPIKTDIGAASWLASVSGFSGILGIFMSSALMDRFGRRIAFILVVVPCVIGWLFIYIGENIPTLMVGRILCALTGATASLGAIIIGEYTAPRYRGIFINLKTTALFAGCMVVHIMGHFMDWRTIAMIAVWPQVIAILIAYTWPESPWLVSKKKYERSEKAFFWLRGKSEEDVREFEELVQAQREKPCAVNKVSVGSICKIFRKFTKKNLIKPATITLLAATLMEASGKHVFPTYAADIMSTITSDSSQRFYYILVIDFIITASTTISTIFIKMMNRRTLLFSTGLIGFIVLMFLCLYLFLEAKNIIVNYHSWIPISGLIAYFILVNLGCTTIPNILFGEIFPLEHRGSGSIIIGIIFSSALFITLKSTPYMLLTIKLYGTFFVFGLVMIMLLILLYFILPETKDKTLLQIEDYFNHGSFNINRDKDEVVRINKFNEA